MNTLIALVVLFLIGTTVFSFIATIYRFFIAMIGNNSTSSQSRQRDLQQRTDLRNKDSVSLKDAFIANNTTRQKYASKSSTASSQKRNQQVQSKQLSRRMQQEAAKRRAEPVRSSSAPKTTLFNENDVKKSKSQTLFDRNDLTSLTPIDKVTSTKKSSYQAEVKTKKTHFQNDYVKGIIYKEILDKPVSLRRTK